MNYKEFNEEFKVTRAEQQRRYRKKHPDLRLSQLLINANDTQSLEYYVEDDDLEDKLLKMEEKNNGN